MEPDEQRIIPLTGMTLADVEALVAVAKKQNLVNFKYGELAFTTAPERVTPPTGQSKPFDVTGLTPEQVRAKQKEKQTFKSAGV